MNLERLRRVYLNSGYTLANASAKICQDIILNKISKSKMNKNITIKGGVVMYGLSNDKRRATRDLDLDFIKYSLADESIKLFIDRLNLVNDRIDILIDGEIEELHHQDYNGKRVNIILRDENNFSLSSKLDIGVHANFDIKQEEYCFNLEALEEKDIFDIYYLINNTDINKDELLYIIHSLIINDKTMKENNLNDIIKNLKITINNNIFKHNLSDARNNWLQVPVNEVINSVVIYFENLETIQV